MQAAPLVRRDGGEEVRKRAREGERADVERADAERVGALGRLVEQEAEMARATAAL